MNEIVKYNNTINGIKFKNFTRRDFNFFFAICAKIRDKHTDQVSLSFQEIKDLANYKETDIARFRRDIESMYDKLDSIIYRYEDDECIEKFHLFSKFKLLKTREEVQIKVDEKFEFLLNDLDKNFTRYELETFVNLTSKHSKTLYRLLKQWRTQGVTKEYKVEELKGFFECEIMENKIFFRDVIKPAMAELEERGLFNNIKCEPIKARKRGAPVVGYKFYFTREEIIREPQKKAIEHKKKGTYKKSESKNKFNNFEQRENLGDEDLEKMLISNNDDINIPGQVEFVDESDFDGILENLKGE